MSIPIGIVLGLVTVIVAGILVVAEAALTATSVGRIEAVEEGGRHLEQRRRRVLALLDRPADTHNLLRMLILTVRAAEVSLVAVAAFAALDPGWAVAAMVANIVALFVLAEAFPRSIGLLHPERAALLLSRPITMMVAAAPIRLVANLAVDIGNRLVPGPGLARGPFPEDFIAMADAAVEDSVIDSDERDLIESVIEFGGTVVREVMIPRTDMTTIEAAATVTGALEVTSDAGYSRVPVVGENIDDVVGLLYVKDLIRAELDGRAEISVGSLVRPATFIPETKRVSELLREMQESSFHMAMAVDEYGGIAGLVTLEDLIEELVGEIVDEYDVEEPLVERQRDGSLQVDARILIDELNDLAALGLPEGDWDTVGGLVFDCFGRIPAEGETCDAGGYTLRVERVHGRRITKVRILGSRPEPAPEVV